MRPFFKRYFWCILAAVGLLLFLAANGLSSGSDRDSSLLSADSDQTLTKQEALASANDWLKQRDELKGVKPSGDYRPNGPVSFQADMNISGYLLQNKLVPDYAKLYKSLYPVEYWQVEMRRDNGDRYILDIDMEHGAIKGWRKQAEGAAPSNEEGQRIATAYLRSIKQLPETFTVLYPDAKHPNRFVFLNSDFKLGEALMQLEVELRGSEVTAYHAGFRAPGSYQDWLEKQDSASGNMGRWNLIMTGIMTLAAIYYMIRYRKQTSFGRGLLLVLVFLGLYIWNNWNQLPAFQAMGFKESEDPFAGHTAAIALVVVSSIFTVGLGLVTYFSLAAGDTLWKVQGMAKWPKWSDPAFGLETLRSMGRGYGLALFMLGLQSTLLWIAQAGFGMWSVNDPSSSYFNFLHVGWFPLMAWAAAISEEAIYRLFGIAFFHRLIRNTFIAVLAPSLIWAFNHTLYPIYPVYTRLIEVTLLGLLFGYAMVKYGFLTALFAHAVIDSTLMGLPLIGWQGAGYSMAGIAYIASPALVAAVIWLLHRTRFKARESLPPRLTPS